MEVNLGERIKFFRKRAHKSQLELEIEIDGSSGMISKIENNQVNPTKETVRNIAKALNLNNRELDYLIGQSSVPVNHEEVEKAKIEASSFLNQKGKLAYLLDDRWRFFMISDTFFNLLKIQPEEYDYVIGKTTAHVITDKNSPVLNWVDDDKYEELLKIYLPIYYSRMSYMNDDPIYQETIRNIVGNSKAREIWQDIINNGSREFASQEERIIPFSVMGVKFNLYYSLYALPINSRFEVVEYHTENRVLNMLKKLI